MLAHAADLKDFSSAKAALHLGGWGFKGLFFGAEPNRGDSVAPDPGIHSCGNGLYFGQLGHDLPVPSLSSQRNEVLSLVACWSFVLCSHWRGRYIIGMSHGIQPVRQSAHLNHSEN